ncbi:MAG: GMP synthase (glutamine-hydrolyzing) [Halocynthiibacter sp.]|jgi:GMP synthase-like glutamine amidotransferase
MKIGILQCGHTPEAVAADHGDFDQMFMRLLGGHGFEFTTYNVVDMAFPAGPDAADGWLITGSRHGAYEDHAFIAPLSDLIRDIAAQKRPMVGICFGHQIIAQALGGKVEKYSGGWSIGREEYAFEGMGQISLNAWHQDQVITAPKGARTISTSPFCEHAALIYGQEIFTVQAHPELSPTIMTDYIKAKRADTIYPPEVIARAIAENAKSTDDARIATYIAEFFLMPGRQTHV